MAMNPGATKRLKEKARQEKREDKAARRLARKEENALERARNPGGIPGVEGFVPPDEATEDAPRPSEG